MINPYRMVGKTPNVLGKILGGSIKIRTDKRSKNRTWDNESLSNETIIYKGRKMEITTNFIDKHPYKTTVEVPSENIFIEKNTKYEAIQLAKIEIDYKIRMSGGIV
jgi:hypothetical protein